jgi:hypothetical protein
MKRALVAALASLMLAGVLAGATGPIVNLGPTTPFSTVEGSYPILANAPFAVREGDLKSR